MAQRSVKEQFQSYIDWWQDEIHYVEKNEPELKLTASRYRGRIHGMCLAAEILGIDVITDSEILDV